MKALCFIFLVSIYPYILAAVYAYQTEKRCGLLRKEINDLILADMDSSYDYEISLDSIEPEPGKWWIRILNWFGIYRFNKHFVIRTSSSSGSYDSSQPDYQYKESQK